jgi:hypothetical protein
VLVRELVEATRALLPAVTREVDEAIVPYVVTIGDLLGSAGVRVGGRRAASLRRAINATWAASIALGRATGRAAVLAALQAAIPDVARKPVNRTAVLAAHEAAWRSITLPPHDPLRILGDVTDPVRRVALAIQLPALPPLVRAEAITTSLAALERHRAPVVAWFLLPALHRWPDLPATVHETVASVLKPAVLEGEVIKGFEQDREWLTTLRTTLAREAIGDQSANLLYNLAARHGSGRPGYGNSGRTRLLNELLDLWSTCERAFVAEVE